MHLLFADTTSDHGLDAIRAAGHHVAIEPQLTTGDLRGRIPGVDILVVRSTLVDAPTLQAADRLSLVVRAGAGTDTIDTAAAADLGIYVCNVPGRNAVAVAELTMGLLLAVDRRIPHATADLRSGQWDKTSYSRASGLLGRTMALIGLGDIGLAVAERAKAFGLVVTALRRDDRRRDIEARIRSIGIRLVDGYDELLAGADIVSLHVPGSATTRGLVDDAFLHRMQPGAILLNTSRGDVVDEAALLKALDSRDLRAGLDVWAHEPTTGRGPFDSPLARHPHVVGTHHIGASTSQAQESVAEGTMEVVRAFLAGQVQNCVNLAADSLGTTCVTVRHLNRVGVLAQVFSLFRAHGLNVEHMQNKVFAGARAAVATVQIDGHPDHDLLAALRATDHVLSVATTSGPPAP